MRKVINHERNPARTAPPTGRRNPPHNDRNATHASAERRPAQRQWRTGQNPALHPGRGRHRQSQYLARPQNVEPLPSTGGQQNRREQSQGQDAFGSRPDPGRPPGRDAAGVEATQRFIYDLEGLGSQFRDFPRPDRGDNWATATFRYGWSQSAD